MITINNFNIQNNGTELIIDLETAVSSTITSVLLWDLNSFKDYTKAINLDYKLIQSSNIEQFVVTNTELEITSFDDIWFIEVLTDEVDAESALGITYNLQPYYTCLLSRFIESTKKICINCNESVVDDITLAISLNIDVLEKAIEEGYYTQAISIISTLKKLCNLSKCTNCNKVKCGTCSKFKQL